MSDVDQQFLNLNLWNLKEISKLADKIMKEHGDSECRSWRYPTKKSSELNLTKVIQTDNYTQILELTIDRTIYVLNLLIEYLEKLEGMDNYCRPGKSVGRPVNLSLAAILNIVWDRIGKFAKTPVFEKNSQMIETSMKTSRLTQTEICKFSKCNSCDLVQAFVTYLVAEIEKISVESEVSKEKKHLKYLLEDSTNWSVMSKWLNAITKDVREILEGSQNLKNELSKCKEETQILKEKIKEDEIRISMMEKQIEDLIDENNKDFERAEMKILQLKNDLCQLKQKKKE